MLAIEKRPRTFQEVLGQDVIKRTMEGYSENEYPQVMFFLGQSGSGKSTSAFIVAATLNCSSPVPTKEHGKEPCGECDSCKAIESGNFNRDIYYYDGGQLRADGIREVIEKSYSGPMYDRNKVFILDEAHLISSKEKFLLLLEKPMKNIYFILCSTEKHKIPKTMYDRGQVFNFKPLTFNQVSDYLMDLLDELDPEEKLPEGIADVLPVIARNCDGSVRKAVADLQRCIDSQIFTKEEILEELGYDDEDTFNTLLFELLEGKVHFFEGLEKVDKFGFVRYALKVISSSAVMGVTGEVNGDDYKQQMAKKINKSKNLKTVVEALNDSMGTAHFNESRLVINLVESFQDTAPVERVSEEKPKRRVRKAKA